MTSLMSYLTNVNVVDIFCKVHELDFTKYAHGFLGRIRHGDHNYLFRIDVNVKRYVLISKEKF